MPAEDVLYPQYFTGAKVHVSMEDCGTSSTDAEFWEEYLADFPEETLSPVWISTDESNFEGDGQSNGSMFETGYGEASTDGYMKEWATIYITECDLRIAQSDREISEPSLEHCAENHVVSPELGMNWADWSELIDDQQDRKVSGPETT